MAGQAKGGNMSTKRGINSIEDLNEAAGFVLDIIKATYGDLGYKVKVVLEHAQHLDRMTQMVTSSPPSAGEQTRRRTVC